MNEWLTDNVRFARDLVESGFEGVNSAYKGAAISKAPWKPAAIGALGGFLCGYALQRKRFSGNAVLGGLLGGAFGVGGVLLWKGRRVVGEAAAQAAQNINSTRDQHWLKKNPVSYG